MLYECWREIARKHRHEMALCELASARRWTFAELAEHSENVDSSDQPISYPHGMTADFVVRVLGAWRAGKVVLPLETGQKAFAVSGLPPGIVHLKTTSASTGAPRAIAVTAAQLKADADNIVQTMGLRPDWPNLGVISLAHSYGFSNLVLPLLLHGIPLLLLDSPFPEKLRRSGAACSGLTLPAVPALWRVWHEAGAVPGNVRLAISAGGAFPLLPGQG